MKNCVLVILCLGLTASAHAQEEKDFFSLSLKKQKAFVNAVNDKCSSLDKKIVASTKRSLAKLKKQEQKLYRKLYKKDSAAAKAFLAESNAKYAALESKLDGDTSGKLKEYLPAFDTLNSSLAYLNKNITADNPIASQLAASQQSAKQLASRLQVANEIKRQLRDRKKQLTGLFEKFGLVKEMKQFNKEIFYYHEQLKEYKTLLKDPRKIEQKAIAALRQSTPFKEFMKKNSMLAQLFKVPGNNGNAPGIAGLQTNSAVAALLAQNVGAGVDPQQYLQQQTNMAQTEMNKLKAKLNKPGSSSDLDMPSNFKPNTQKTKSFLKRLEYGANFQTQKLSSYFPATTDIALSFGYKLNDKSIVGLGASYKLGLGKNWNAIKFTNEGIGLRSFVDLKLKGSLWITGGYEQNYLKNFSSLQQLNEKGLWNQSALLGLTRRIRVRSKTTKIQLLYDFFYDKTKSYSQPLVFRVGYNF